MQLKAIFFSTIIIISSIITFYAFIKSNKDNTKERKIYYINIEQPYKTPYKKNNSNDYFEFKKIKYNPSKFFAHRGLLNFAPENTLLSFRIAKERGFKNIELDIVTTRDDKIVVFHDLKLDRIFNLDTATCDIDYDKLSKLKPADFFFKDRLGLKKEQIDEIVSLNDPWINKINSQNIPLLDDLFRNYGTYFNYHLDIKILGCSKPLQKELMALISKYGLESKVYIESKNLDFLKDIISINPKIKTIYWKEKFFRLGEDKQNELKNLGIDSIDLNYKNVYTKASKNVKYFKIHTYTVNSYDLVDTLYGNVDFIITDLDIINKTDRYQFFNEKSKKVKFIH